MKSLSSRPPDMASCIHIALQNRAGSDLRFALARCCVFQPAMTSLQVVKARDSTVAGGQDDGKTLLPGSLR